MKSESLLDEITQAITAEAPDTELTPITEVELPEVYYDGRQFYIPNSSGGWVPVTCIRQGSSSSVVVSVRDG